ncbi:MAG: hypothetical protein LBB26_00785, partial [Puniceicoccales bacterium]|nr:hypothetical protein [Puniceicoccales bacterium]
MNWHLFNFGEKFCQLLKNVAKVHANNPEKRSCIQDYFARVENGVSTRPNLPRNTGEVVLGAVTHLRIILSSSVLPTIGCDLKCTLVQLLQCIELFYVDPTRGKLVSAIGRLTLIVRELYSVSLTPDGCGCIVENALALEALLKAISKAGALDSDRSPPAQALPFRLSHVALGTGDSAEIGELVYDPDDFLQDFPDDSGSLDSGDPSLLIPPRGATERVLKTRLAALQAMMKQMTKCGDFGSRYNAVNEAIRIIRQRLNERMRRINQKKRMARLRRCREKGVVGDKRDILEAEDSRLKRWATRTQCNYASCKTQTPRFNISMPIAIVARTAPQARKREKLSPTNRFN